MAGGSCTGWLATGFHLAQWPLQFFVVYLVALVYLWCILTDIHEIILFIIWWSCHCCCFVCCCRQSYDVEISVAVPGTTMKSSNVLDLKNPFFRYTGQQPQPPPGNNHTSPSEAYWNQHDLTAGNVVSFSLIMCHIKMPLCMLFICIIWAP